MKQKGGRKSPPFLFFPIYVMDIKILSKISSLAEIFSKNNKEYIDGNEKLKLAYEELKAADIQLAKETGEKKKVKNLLKKFKVLVGYSENNIKKILLSLKDENLSEEKFDDFLTEVAVAFNTVMHHLDISDDEEFSNEIANIFNPDSFRRITRVSQYFKTIPADLELTLTSIHILSQELSSLHELKIPELNVIICGQRPIESFSLDYIESANQVHDDSPYKKDNMSHIDWDEIESDYKFPGDENYPNQEFWDKKKQSIQNKEMKRKFKFKLDPKTNKIRTAQEIAQKEKSLPIEIDNIPNNINPSDIPLLRKDVQPKRDEFGRIDREATERYSKSLETPFLLSW